MVNCEFIVYGTDEVIFITTTMHLPLKNDIVCIEKIKYKIIQVEFNYETKQNYLDRIIFHIEQL
jgi:hypothetical protein